MVAAPATTPSTLAPQDAEVLIVVDDRWPGGDRDDESSPGAALDPRDGLRVQLVRASELDDGSAGVRPLDRDFVAGGVPGPASILGPALRQAVRRGSAALAVVAESTTSGACLRTLLSPVVEQGYDWVCPCYSRGRFDGMLGTALVYPLVRAVYGYRLRQPSGGEAVVSGALAQELLDDPDWDRDPVRAGSDAWLVAKVLASEHRLCEGWIGARCGQARADDEPSHALSRLVGPVFHEMERYADRWQRIEGSAPVTRFGETGAADGPAREVAIKPLIESFRLGVRELDPLWASVLSPATRMSLRRQASAGDDQVRVEDSLWARIVYDFAVAHSTRVLERRQLLASLTPIYLGWIAGFVRDVRGLAHAACEARVEALCTAFECEKRYLVKRWRWPDGFNP